MEQNIKMPANFAEMNNEDMAYTEGGNIRINVTRNGMFAVRNMTVGRFGTYICQCVGVNANSALGQQIASQARARYGAVASGTSVTLYCGIARTIRI